MSYCVHCGVELDDTAKKCALCDTAVINPNQPTNDTDPALPFPDKIVLPASKKKRYRAVVATLVMMLPMLICIPVNYFITPEKNWAVYVVSTLVLAWFFFVAPFLMHRIVPNYPYLSLTLDGLITVAYIYVFYWMNSSGSWFYRIAVPMVVAFVLLGYLMIYYFKKKEHSLLRKIAFTLAIIAIYAAAIEFIFLISMPNPIVDCISIVAFFTSATIAIFLRFASENKQFRAWITRKFFL